MTRNDKGLIFGYLSIAAATALGALVSRDDVVVFVLAVTLTGLCLATAWSIRRDSKTGRVK